MKTALEVTHEITKLIKHSPRREAIFKEVRKESEAASSDNASSCSHALWSYFVQQDGHAVRADMHSSKYYTELFWVIEYMDQAVEIVKDTETR